MRPMRMTVYLQGKRYAVDTAQLLAHGERDADIPGAPATATFLFRTQDGSYFVQHRASPSGSGDPHDERVWIDPISDMDAAALFSELQYKEVSFDEAFAEP